MKTKLRLLLFTFLFISCGSDGLDSDNNPNDPDDSVTYSANGSIQKGPFIQGSSITIQELDESFNPTGKSYQTTTTDGAGSFSIGSQVESRYVEIIASGYYYNEVSGDLSASTLTLRSVSDLKNSEKVNVNLLTSLSSERIKYLVTDEGMSFYDAQIAAEEEVLAIFGISKSDTRFDQMDIANNSDADAKLLGISITLQSSRTEAVLSQLIATISSEIKANGEIVSESIKESIQTGGMNISLETVRDNLVARYEELGEYCSPAEFEDYVDSSGNGVLNSEEYWTGNGSSYDPYQIWNKSDLKYLASMVNSGSSYLYRYFRMMEDINLEGDETDQWDSIGQYNYADNIPFQGTFDGGGFEVSGLYIVSSDYSYQAQGLFGYATSGEIKNLGVSGVLSANSEYTGGVVGYSQSTISNCYNAASVSGRYYVGGITGSSSSSISNCYNTGDISNGQYAGGIVGRAGTSITNCYNTGKVTGSMNIGGIAGFAWSYARINNCYNIGNIGDEGYSVESPGSIVGYAWNIYVTNCYWLQGTADYGLGADRDNYNVTVTSMTQAEMQTEEFVNTLNSNATTNCWIYNAGEYPTIDLDQ